MSRETYALGMLEFSSIARGIESADQMVKAARVEPLFFKTVCPGKYLAAVRGNTASVNAAVDAGRDRGGVTVTDWFTLANLHPDVFPALCGASVVPPRNALGILESYSVPSIVLAADAAAKAASVSLLEVRAALGLGGKGYALLCGDVAAVQAAVDAGAARIEEAGLLVARTTIPSPDPALWQQVL